MPNLKASQTAKEEVPSKLLTHPILRVFPLENDYVAAVILKSLQENLPEKVKYIYSVFKPVPPKGYNSRKSFQPDISDYQPYVLANGFYFHEKDQKSDVLKHKNPVMKIWNVHKSYSANIHESLETSLSAAVQSKEKKPQIVCVSKDRQRIYFYDLRNNSLTNNNPPGIITYQANSNEKIFSIATLPHSKLAIAFDTGEIKIGQIHMGAFFENFQLTTPLGNEIRDFQLFFSPKGFLVGYSANKSLLRIWDIHHKFEFVDHYCSKLYNLSMSTSGKYLTALINQGSTQSNSVQIFQLKPFHQYDITFEKAITDFAIGYENNICIARENRIEYPGTVKKYLNQYCQLTNEQSDSLYKEPSLCSFSHGFFAKLINKEITVKNKIEKIATRFSIV